MSAPATSPTSPPAAHGSHAPWRVFAFGEVSSTNAVAAHHRAWDVIVARTQLCGRGRRERRWVSDSGGLWMSAVVPAAAPAERWAILPLAAGWAVCSALESLGVFGLRLRWPNDVMVGPRKLAGILVERFNARTAVVGVGVNHLNQPDLVDPSLRGEVVSLAGLIDPLVPVETVRDTILDRLSAAHRAILISEGRTLAEWLQPYWRRGPVLALVGAEREPVTGDFAGVDAAGRLRLVDAGGGERFLDAAEVELLREVTPGA